MVNKNSTGVLLLQCTVNILERYTAHVVTRE